MLCSPNLSLPKCFRSQYRTQSPTAKTAPSLSPASFPNSPFISIQLQPCLLPLPSLSTSMFTAILVQNTISLTSYLESSLSHIPSPSHRLVKATFSVLWWKAPKPSWCPWNKVQTTRPYMIQPQPTSASSLCCTRPGYLPVLIANPHPYSWLCTHYPVFFLCLAPASKLTIPSSWKLFLEPDLPKDGSSIFSFQFRLSSLRLFWNTLSNDQVTP